MAVRGQVDPEGPAQSILLHCTSQRWVLEVFGRRASNICFHSTSVDAIWQPTFFIGRAVFSDCALEKISPRSDCLANCYLLRSTPR